MTADPLALGRELDHANQRLLDRVATMDDAMTRGRSQLPGWTRGHVLAHIARNADSLVNLLTSARTGEYLPAYPSRQVRDEQIEAGSARPVAAHLADLRESAARFAEALAAMSPGDWAAMVPVPDGERPAATLVWVRLREVEVHHVDLDAGYTCADWPDAFGQRLLHEAVADLRGQVSVPVLLCPDGTGHPLRLDPAGHGTGGAGAAGHGTGGDAPGGPDAADDPPDDGGAAGAVVSVSGPAYALAGWLTGRSTGGLTVDPDGPLPALPTWR